MNAFTKVLVVLVLLLSLLFTGSQMVLHAKREHFGKLYLAERQDHNSTKAKLKETGDALKAAQDSYGKLQESSNIEIADLKQKLTDEQTRSRQVNAEREQLNASLQVSIDRTNKLENEVATRNGIIDELKDTVVQRDRRISDNSNQIEQLQTTVVQRDKTIRQLDFDLTELKKAHNKLAISEERLQAIVGELVERGVHIPPAPLPVINGRVVRVDGKLGVAVVDKGASDGVKPNTQFTIYDGAKYVAKLIIHDVQSDVSAGRLMLVAAGQMPKQGDKATTEIP